MRKGSCTLNNTKFLCAWDPIFDIILYGPPGGDDDDDW